LFDVCACRTEGQVETGSDARAGIGAWLAYYNAERPHSTHEILTPDVAYETKTEPMKLAA